MVSSSSSSSSYLQQKKNPSGVEGYGSIEASTPLVLMGDDEDHDVELFVANQAHHRRSSSKLTMLAVVASLLILGAVVYLPGVGSSGLLRSSSSSSSDASLMNLFPMLGKSKLTAEEKLAAKQAKEAKKLAKAQAKQAKKDAKAKAKAEKDKAEEAKKQAKEAAKFHPSSYPGCLEVNVTYVSIPLSFEAHEMAATAAGCHLASVHSTRENTKFARAGLFELSFGPEIASTFTSGTLLTKDYYLGGKTMGGNWTWTDDSDWDFGVVSLATTSTGSCLTAYVNFTEIAMPNISYTDHWEASEDCEIPLPAIYKCCLTPSPSTAPEADETEE